MKYWASRMGTIDYQLLGHLNKASRPPSVLFKLKTRGYIQNSCKPLHLFFFSLKISPTTPFLYVSIWMQHHDKELYLQSGAGHQRVSAYTAKTRRTMKSSYFSYWALSFKIIRISENKLKLHKMDTIQVTKPLNIFLLGWIKRESTFQYLRHFGTATYKLALFCDAWPSAWQ